MTINDPNATDEEKGEALVWMLVDAATLGAGHAFAAVAGLGRTAEGLKGAGSAINVTDRGLAHVAVGHVSGGMGTAGKSVFSGSTAEVRGLIERAASVPPVAQAGPNFERVVDAGRAIGMDRATGQATTIYTVITDKAGNLVTAFPGRP